jgi:hypothetical protein
LPFKEFEDFGKEPVERHLEILSTTSQALACLRSNPGPLAGLAKTAPNSSTRAATDPREPPARTPIW